MLGCLARLGMELQSRGPVAAACHLVSPRSLACGATAGAHFFGQLLPKSTPPRTTHTTYSSTHGHRRGAGFDETPTLRHTASGAPRSVVPVRPPPRSASGTAQRHLRSSSTLGRGRRVSARGTKSSSIALTGAPHHSLLSTLFTVRLAAQAQDAPPRPLLRHEPAPSTPSEPVDLASRLSTACTRSTSTNRPRHSRCRAVACRRRRRPRRSR